jgi:exosortase E/protease (VPEID-CTERM system)
MSGLLAAEVLALTIRYDTGTLVGQSAWWAETLLLAPHLLRLAVAVFAAAALFAGPTLWKELNRAAIPTTHPGWRWLFVGLHLVTFLGFERCCAAVFGGGLAESAHAGLWLAAWLILGAATLASYALAVMPGQLWLTLGARSWRPLLTGLLVGVLAYAGCFLSAELWESLGEATLIVVRNILRLWEPTAYCLIHERVVGTEAFAVEISRQCSGYEGIGLATALLVAYIGLNRDRFRFPQAILLLPLGALAIWLANALRIALLVSIGSHWSAEVALGGFHSQAGWIAFNAICLGLVFVAQRLPFFAHRPHAAPRESRSAAYLLPFLVVLAVAMLTSALSASVDYLYPLRVMAAAVVLWHFRRAYQPELHFPVTAAMLVGVVVFALWLGLGRLASPQGAASTVEVLDQLGPTWAVLWLAFRIAGSVVIAPIVEELAFRGYLMRRLRTENWEAAAPSLALFPLLISSLLFGALHERWLAGTLAGLCYGWVYYRRGRLSDAILAHAVTNALLAVTALVSGDWSNWS